MAALSEQASQPWRRVVMDTQRLLCAKVLFRLSLPKATGACWIVLWTSLSLLLSSETMLPSYLVGAPLTGCSCWVMLMVSPSCCRPSQLHPGQPGGLVDCEPYCSSRTLTLCRLVVNYDLLMLKRSSSL